jgi:hypothetical protein
MKRKFLYSIVIISCIYNSIDGIRRGGGAHAGGARRQVGFSRPSGARAHGTRAASTVARQRTLARGTTGLTRQALVRQAAVRRPIGTPTGVATAARAAAGRYPYGGWGRRGYGAWPYAYPVYLGGAAAYGYGDDYYPTGYDATNIANPEVLGITPQYSDIEQGPPTGQIQYVPVPVPVPSNQEASQAQQFITPQIPPAERGAPVAISPQLPGQKAIIPQIPAPQPPEAEITNIALTPQRPTAAQIQLLNRELEQNPQGQ